MDNKNIILQCALNLFYAKGYDAVGVQEIVDSAGVSKPTLYHYFGSKLGLLENLLDLGFTDMSRKIEAVMGREDGLPEILYRVARAFFDFATENYKFYMLMLSLFYSARENEAFHAVSPYVRGYYQIIIRLFTDASNHLGNMRGRQEQFAAGFTGIMNHHILMLSYIAKDGEQIRVSNETTYEIVHQFMYGIYS